MKKLFLIFLIALMAVNVCWSFPSTCEGNQFYYNLTQRFYEVRVWFTADGCNDGYFVKRIKFFSTGENTFLVKSYDFLHDCNTELSIAGTAVKMEMPNGQYLLTVEMNYGDTFLLTFDHYSDRFYCGNAIHYGQSAYCEMERVFKVGSCWNYLRAGQYIPLTDSGMRFGCQ
jgi:hypothetical protein